jgi:hypothetical protein
MQCKEVELVLQQEGIAPLPMAARAHLVSCNACQSLVADLKDIVAAAHELPAELEPPARLWVSLRAQLENEGIIKTPAAAGAERVSWWHGFSKLFRGRALATASVGLLIVAAGVLQIQRPPVQLTDTPNPFEETARALAEQEHGLTNMQLASNSLVDTSLRQNLTAVDDFIADCERRVQAEPQDELAREYLSGAYRQKAQLLSAMMERGGSGN